MAKKAPAEISPLVKPYLPQEPVPLTTPDAIRAHKDELHRYVAGDPLEEMAQRWRGTLTDAGFPATPGVPFFALRDGRVLMRGEPEYVEWYCQMLRIDFTGIKSWNAAGQLAALVKAKGHAIGTPMWFAAEILDSVHELRQLEFGSAPWQWRWGALNRLDVRARIESEHGKAWRRAAGRKPQDDALSDRNARKHSQARARDEEWLALADGVLAANPSAGSGCVVDAIKRQWPELNRDYIRQRVARLRKEK